MSVATAIWYAALGAVLDTTVYAIMKYGTVTPFIDIHFEGAYILAFVVTALAALRCGGRRGRGRVLALIALRVGLSTTVLDCGISLLPLDVDDRIELKKVIRSLVGAHLWSREGAYVQRAILWMCLGFSVPSARPPLVAPAAGHVPAPAAAPPATLASAAPAARATPAPAAVPTAPGPQPAAALHFDRAAPARGGWAVISGSQRIDRIDRIIVDNRTVQAVRAAQKVDAAAHRDLFSDADSDRE